MLCRAFVVLALAVLTTALRSPLRQRISTTRRRADANPLIGLEAPEFLLLEAEKQAEEQEEVDFVVIGSGIGGLSAASLLAWHGYSVCVLESHYLAGGCAHTFERKGFKFDAGPSLWNGMNKKPYNPLREVLEIIGEASSIEYAKFDGWVMHTPDGSFKFTVGKDKFEPILAKFGGANVLAEWEELRKKLVPIQKLARAIPPLALRSDIGLLLTLLPHLPKLLVGLPHVAQVENSFKSISGGIVKDKFLEHWIDFLSFALSGIPADGTIAAAVAYTMQDIHQENAQLDYPIGGSGAVIDALVRGVTKHKGNKLLLNTHVESIVVEDGKAVGVKVRRPKGKMIRAKKGVVSNASIWDTTLLLGESIVKEKAEKNLATPRTGSFVHLHIGIDATGLPADLESHYSVINSWEPIDAPQNHVIISIPSTLDPTMAPPNCHVIHAYAAANEPFELFDGLSPSSDEYKKLKEERCDFLWKAIEKSIPDVRSRVLIKLEGSPLTHARFNRRYKGTYGPALRAGESKFPYPADLGGGIKGLYCCGDSVFPGIGVPAVAASGANAASSCVSVSEHLAMMERLYEIQAM